MRKTSWIIPVLLLFAAVSAPYAYADTLTDYTVNFTLTAGSFLPTSGSFTYDSTNPSFSNFLVAWDGAIYDLTSSANSPVTNGTFPPCIGGLTGAAASFALLSGQCTPPAAGFQTYWEGENNGFTAFFQFITYANVGFEALEVFQLQQTVTGQAFGLGQGPWTLSASPVPEPSTLVLLLTALLSVAIVARTRIA